jgi:hypothetical protein
MVLMEQQADNSFINKAAELGIAITNPKGTITLDINRDGKIDILTTTNEFYQNTKESPITFILNSEKVDTTANRVIKSEDVLLVSIGTVDAKKLQEQYTALPKDAGEYNKKYDPAGCSGGKDFTFMERLKKSIGVFGN